MIIDEHLETNLSTVFDGALRSDEHDTTVYLILRGKTNPRGKHGELVEKCRAPGIHEDTLVYSVAGAKGNAHCMI